MEHLPLALASRFFEKKCQLVMSFTQVKKGAQLLVPKKKASPQIRPPGDTSSPVLELRASSEPLSCLLEGSAFEVIARLLRSYHSIALAFFERQRPNATLNAFREAALRGPGDTRGFRRASLHVELPLDNGNTVKLIAERESPLRGEAYSETLKIEMREGRSRNYSVELLADGFTEEEQLDEFGYQTEDATHILGVLKASPRPWKGRYSCSFRTNGFVVLSNAGPVTCRFEKLYSAVFSVNDATSKRALVRSESPQRSARKRRRPRADDPPSVSPGHASLSGSRNNAATF